MGWCTVGELWTICFTLFNPRVWLLVFSGLLPIKLPSISRSCSTPKQRTVSTFSIEVGFLLLRGCPSSPRPSPPCGRGPRDCWLWQTHTGVLTAIHMYTRVNHHDDGEGWGGVGGLFEGPGTGGPESAHRILLLNLQRATKEKEKEKETLAKIS